MSHRVVLARLSDPKVMRFLAAGVLNTVFGYSVFAALLFFGVPYLAALFVATVAGVVFNYFSFGRMVFDGHGNWSVFGRFVAAYLVIYAVNAALLGILKTYFLLSPYVGQVICIPLGVLLSWLLMNYWVYKK